MALKMYSGKAVWNQAGSNKISRLEYNVDRIVSSVNRRVQRIQPHGGRTPRRSEQCQHYPLALDSPNITIRRFPQPFQLSDLVNRNSLHSSRRLS